MHYIILGAILIICLPYAYFTIMDAVARRKEADCLDEMRGGEDG